MAQTERLNQTKTLFEKKNINMKTKPLTYLPFLALVGAKRMVKSQNK